MIVPKARFAGKQLDNCISPEANRYKWELAKEIDNYQQYGRNWDAMRGMNLDPKQRETVSRMMDMMQSNMTKDQRKQFIAYLDDLRDADGVSELIPARQNKNISSLIGNIVSIIIGLRHNTPESR